MRTIPKKYRLDTNGYGNLNHHPAGWLTFESADISKRKKHHRSALCSDRLFTYQVCVGFTGGSRHGWSPILVDVVHPDQLPLFQRLVAQSEKQSKVLKDRENRRKRTKKYKVESAQRRAEVAQRRAERAAERAAERLHLDHLCQQCGIVADDIGRTLARNLRDITEAHPDWLRNAYDALEFSLDNNGIMAKFFNNRCEDISFYHALCIAIRASKRHRDTDYDDLLDAGMDQESARFLAAPRV